MSHEEEDDDEGGEKESRNSSDLDLNKLENRDSVLCFFLYDLPESKTFSDDDGPPPPPPAPVELTCGVWKNLLREEGNELSPPPLAEASDFLAET